jgi:hypothetical protein
MRATTIRFTPELWALLQREAEREGVSVAQYVRDSALFRVAYSAGLRREQEPDPPAAPLSGSAGIR